MKPKYICIIIGVVALFSVSVQGSLNEDVRQYVSSMKASYGRIQSIQAVMDLCTWESQTKGSTASYIKNCSTVEYRRVKGRMYCRSTKHGTLPDGTPGPDQQEIAAFDGTHSKLLRKVTVEPVHYRAQRMSGTQLVEQLTYTPDMMIGGISFPDWDSIDRNLDKVMVSTDPDTGWVILDYPVFDNDKAPRCRIWIAVEKDFFPVRREIRRLDGTLLIKEECRGLKQTDGFWVPTEFIVEDPVLETRSTCTIREIKINPLIDPTMLDFEYPDKTIVNDDVTGTRYMIDRRKSQSLSGGSSLPNNVQDPISEEALSASAGKGDELIRQAFGTKQQPSPPKFFPAFVWVLPGKNQYTLELGSNSKTKPALSGKSISDSPLAFQGIDDQLAASGKILVTVERPAGQKDFADAVLTLDFAGTKVPIHFVAAPLP